MTAPPRAGAVTAGQFASAAAWIVLVGALGTALALQGWRSRVPGTDVIPYIDSAHAFLSRGQIPERGVVTSLDSYSPPGLVWAVIPGVSVVSDLRLVDAPGWVLLYLGTLVGVFLVARTCFGTRCAFLSVLIYGLSERGLNFAGSMSGADSVGPTGHPFFYVWMAYWMCCWVTRRDARYLALACLTWIVGMWVFIVLAPALFMIPVVWMLYRPPVRVRPLIAVGAVALVIWFPYLRFESARGFADVRSQLLLRDLTPAGYSDALCNPALKLQRWATAAGGVTRGTTLPPLAMTIGGHALAAARSLVVNFDGLVPGAGPMLLTLTIIGLTASSVAPRALVIDPDEERMPSIFGRSWLTVCAIGLLTWAIVANEAVVGRILSPRVLGPFAITSIRSLQGLAALGGLGLLARRHVARLSTTLADALGSKSPAPRVLAVALAVPWTILIVMVEPGREDRLAGLFPLQAIVLSFVMLALVAAVGLRARLAGWLGASMIAMLMLINPFVVSRIEAWHRQGWFGPDAVEVRIADYLAARLQFEGQTHAAIGYRLFGEGPPTPPPDRSDVRWKVGEEFDIVLEYARGITNLNQCVEGISPRDEYRVVEVSPSSPSSGLYFDVPLPGHLRLLDRIGNYDVYRRQ